ncbi:MAG: hypothetical protein M1837_004239 [Sclerophora amabilis]|nr:MAG: hypothetical protein M1837_004239 [Sclerophora amabilis]
MDEPTLGYDINLSRVGRRRSKAHKLLGPPSPLYLESSKAMSNVSERCRDDADSRSTTISVAEVISDEEMFAHQSPTAAAPCITPLPNSFSRRGSRASSEVLSPELLRNTAISSAATEPDGARRIPSSESISTLRSFYDRKRSPLAVSQQTSASSARDLALRKGCPPIAETNLDRTTTTPPVTTAPRSERDPHKGPQKLQKKKPRQLDFAKLFPKPRTARTELISPLGLTHSPSSMSLASDASLSAASDRSGFFRSLGRRKSERHGTPQGDRSGNRAFQQGPAPNSKAASVLGKADRKPKGWLDVDTRNDNSGEVRRERREGSQWPSFERPPPVTPSSDLHRRSSNRPKERSPEHAQILNLPTNTNRVVSNDPTDPAPQSAQSLNSPPLTPRGSSHLSVDPSPQTPLGFSFPTNGSLHPLSSSLGKPKSSCPWDRKSVYSASSRCTATSRKTSISAFSNADLRKDSVLSLSSSDEDDFSDDDTSISAPLSEGKRSSTLSSSMVGVALTSPKRISADSPSSFSSRNVHSIRPKTAPAGSDPIRFHSRTHPHLAEIPLPKQYNLPWTNSSNVNYLGITEKNRRQSAFAGQNRAERPNSVSVRPRSMNGQIGARESADRIVAVTKEEQDLLEAVRAQETSSRRTSVKDVSEWNLHVDPPTPIPPALPFQAGDNHGADRRGSTQSSNFDQSVSTSQSDLSDLSEEQYLDDILSALPVTMQQPATRPELRFNRSSQPVNCQPLPCQPSPNLPPGQTSRFDSARQLPANVFRVPNRRSSLRGPIY